jgi:hypothetical protein
MSVHSQRYDKEALPELTCRYDINNRVVVYTVSPTMRLWYVVVDGVYYSWRVDQGTTREYFHWFKINNVESSNMTLLATLRERFSQGTLKQSTPQNGGYTEMIYSVCEYI